MSIIKKFSDKIHSASNINKNNSGKDEKKRDRFEFDYDEFRIKTKEREEKRKQEEMKKQEATKQSEVKKSFFGNDLYINRDRIRQKAAMMHPNVEGFNRELSRDERVKMAQGIFGASGHISKENLNKIPKDLEKQRQRAKTYAEKKQIEDKIKFYKAIEKGV